MNKLITAALVLGVVTLIALFGIYATAFRGGKKGVAA